MVERIHYTEEQLKENRERMARIHDMIIEGLRKAAELGIQDMTQNEADEYLKKKELDQKKETETK